MKLRVGGHLSYYLPGRQTRLEIPLEGPLRLQDLFIRLGIPAAEVGVAAINGELVLTAEGIVTDADNVELHPPIGGGHS
jgi:sulfur carrier protein ThiS